MLTFDSEQLDELRSLSFRSLGRQLDQNSGQNSKEQQLVGCDLKFVDFY